jgi:hypothetical protein
MKSNCARFMPGRLPIFLLAVLIAGATGCASGSHASQGAAEGATTGAVAGAVGGMFTALVFGGNIAEAGARGAVYGGSSGAVVGGMAGAKTDKAIAEAEAERKRAEQQAQQQKLREQIGTDAFNGLVALVQCKHDIAVANAREAAKSGNKDYALSGVWVETLTEADRNRDAQARALFPQLVSRDKKLKDEADAEARMNQLLERMREIRLAHDLPAQCS